MELTEQSKIQFLRVVREFDRVYVGCQIQHPNFTRTVSHIHDRPLRSERYVYYLEGGQAIPLDFEDWLIENWSICK